MSSANTRASETYGHSNRGLLLSDKNTNPELFKKISNSISSECLNAHKINSKTTDPRRKSAKQPQVIKQSLDTNMLNLPQSDGQNLSKSDFGLSDNTNRAMLKPTNIDQKASVGKMTLNSNSDIGDPQIQISDLNLGKEQYRRPPPKRIISAM
jgi:hypothetical protein